MKKWQKKKEKFWEYTEIKKNQKNKNKKINKNGKTQFNWEQPQENNYLHNVMIIYPNWVNNLFLFKFLIIYFSYFFK